MNLNHARAILWVQWRTLRNVYPRAGVAFSVIIGAVWYGVWLVAAVAAAVAVANPGNLTLLSTALPGALLVMFLYWQVVPLMMAASGASLDLRKLLAYPIPIAQFFGIEVLLRTTAALEMLALLLGIAAGVLVNPGLPVWGVLGVGLYIAFNLFLAVGIRDVVSRLLAHKYIREIGFFLLILLVGLPQIALRRFEAGSPINARAQAFLGATTWPGLPWTAASNLMQGHDALLAGAVLLTWCIAAAAFARWQFGRTLTFDAAAASAGSDTTVTRAGALEAFFQLPSLLLKDPMAAMIEKELRFLSRSPRFRLVFLMGFTFGLMIWLPIMFGGGTGPRGFLGGNYLTVVSVYSLLLLSEVCFWNSFGFDRSAAQIYFLAPVDFAKVLIAKNISGMVFVAIEIAMIALVCSLLRMPFSLLSLAEAYAVAGVVSIYLLAAGNLMSVHQARSADPSKSFRTAAAGRTQAMLFLIYPIAFAPAALAYLARYAFESDAALFLVLAVDAVLGFVIYRIALDSAAQSALRLREQMITKLSQGGGPIAA